MLESFLHASAPEGMKCMKCVDCTMDQEPCPLCYTAGWKKKHPNNYQINSTDSGVPLTCRIEGETIIIRIGFDLLANGAENIPEMFDSGEKIKICNKTEFAKDVVLLLLGAFLEEKKVAKRLVDRLADNWVCFNGSN